MLTLFAFLILFLSVVKSYSFHFYEYDPYACSVPYWAVMSSNSARYSDGPSLSFLTLEILLHTTLPLCPSPQRRRGGPPYCKGPNRDDRLLSFPKEIK